MIKWIFFLLNCSLLYAQGYDALSIISAENEPSAFIEDKINTITGKWVESNKDLVIQGVQPIVIRRTFAHGEWSIFPSFTIEEATSHSQGHSYTILENSGARVRYKFTDQKIYIQGERYRKYIPVDLEQGYTNTSKGSLSSRTNLHNNILFVDRKEKQLILHRSDGSVCTYRKVHHGRGKYSLISEHLPNGNWIFYEYEDIGKKDYRQVRLRSIRTTNPSQDQIYARADFSYEDRKWRNKDFKITGSDGQKIEYTYKKDNPHHYRDVLAAVKSSNQPNQYFSYFEFSFPLAPQRCLQKISLPLDRQLLAHFYTANTKEVNGREVGLQSLTYKETYAGKVWDKVAVDPRCGRVMTLSAPVGADATLYITHSFFYDLLNRTTSVFDIENQRVDYHWDDHCRLKEIVSYSADGTLQKSSKFSWSSSGNLMCRSLIDEKQKPVWAKKYSYNAAGDVVEERIFGNLSGKGSPLMLDANQLPIDNGVESYFRRFTYFNGKNFSLLASEEEENGKKIEYTYLPETDLITSQTTIFQGVVQEKKFLEYDANHLLIKETIETGPLHLITRITPKPSAPYFGMPWIIEEKYLEEGKECPLRKTVLSYTSGARIAQKEIYDSENKLCYTLYYQYDEKGRLIEQSDAVGRLERFNYDDCGNQILHKHPCGRKISIFKYDCSNRLIDALQNGDDGIALHEEYAYDKKSRLIHEKKPLGLESSFSYDPFGNLHQKQIHSIGTFAFVYDSFGRLLSEEKPDGSIVKTTYNATHRPTRIEYPDGGIEEFIYYPNGLLKTQIDQEGIKTSYTYNYQGSLLSKTKAYKGEGINEEFFEYDGPYLVAKVDAEGNRTSFSYDSAGRLITSCLADEKCEFSYDSLGRQILEKKGSLSTVRKIDLLDRVVEEIKIGEGQVFTCVQYEYDLADNRILMTRFIDGKESKKKWIYDSIGRQIQAIDPLGNCTQTIYEHTPFLKEIAIDPMGLKISKKYNALQKLIAIETFNSQGEILSKQERKLDFRGNIIEKAFQFPRARTHHYVYDSMGRLSKKMEAAERPYAKITQYSYDRLGRLTKLVKPDKTSLNYVYGPLGYLNSMSSSDQSILYFFSHDRLGRQLAATDVNANQTTTKKYDAQGRIIEETIGTGFTTFFEYDRSGNRVQWTLPDSSFVRYEYDPLHLRKIARYSPSYELQYTHNLEEYDQDGNVLQERSIIPALDPVQYRYNATGKKDGIFCSQFSQEIGKRDLSGNILHYTLNGDSQDFHYDDLHQLISENEHNYMMDANYCRLQKDRETYEFNDLMQMISHWEYDSNGNPIREGNTCFSYDALDRLTEIQTPEKRILFTYDFDHRRLSKTVFHKDSSTTTLFLYDGFKEVGTINACGTITQLRTLNPTTPSEIGSAIAFELGDKVYAPIYDLAGNVCLLLSSATKTVEASYSYTAFGEEESTGTVSNFWRFASKRVDEESGLVYFGRRYYYPRFGRWLTPDPAESSENLYAFVSNNPLLYTDLFGLYTTDRASDSHFFDRNHPSTSNFAIGLIGDADLGTVNYHCGIKNSQEDVVHAQTALYKILQEQYAIAAHWIHDDSLFNGLNLVSSEKLAKFRFGQETIQKLGIAKDIIDYEIKLLSSQAEIIRSENNPRLKQLHILFSNASYPFREALKSLSPEDRDTIIAISLGPTTLIERNLAHYVSNVIGLKDWPSRACHGVFRSLIQRDNDFDVEFISQTETKPGVFGHYFEQSDYHKFIKAVIGKEVRSKYEIY